MSSAPGRSLVTRLASVAAGKWKITAALWLIVLSLGLYSYFGGLNREGFPSVDVPVALATGTYFADDPELIDREISAPIAEALGTIDGVDRVETESYEQNFVIVAQFEQNLDAEPAELMQQAIDSVELPPEATIEQQAIEATKFVDDYDILVTVTGPDDATAAELETQAAALSAHLDGAPGVERAEPFELLTEGQSASGTEVRQTSYTRASFPGTDGFREAISIGVARDSASDLDVLQFSDGLNDSLDAETALAEGYDAAITADQAPDVRAQVSSLITNLLSGLIAVAIVSLLLIGWRVSIVTAFFMGTVTLASLASLWLFGYTLNTITLFGLILTLGLLVDDAVVISESIDSNRDEPMDGFADRAIGVVNRAVERVGSASLAGTLTTVLVFAPMLFISGILGSFIRAIPVTVIVTLLLSYLFSIVLISAVAKPFLLRGSGTPGPLTRGIRAIARWLGKLAEYPSSHGAKGIAVGLGLTVLALGSVVGAGGLAGSLGFNIFPSSDDANAMFVEGTFEPGQSIEEAQATAREVDSIVADVVGDELDRSQYITGNERSLLIYATLTPFDSREVTAPAMIDDINRRLADVDGIRVNARALEYGPPSEEYPFATQISVGDHDPEQLRRFAEELRATLVGAELDKSGEATTITEAIVSTDGFVYRLDGERTIEVRASYSNDDLTNNLEATESLVTEQFGEAELAEYGLTPDDLGFDYGFESDNQEDFASLGPALLIALALMLVLLIVQFRSIVQPLLIFLAIPFSLLGVTVALKATGNPLSFFSALGFIALMGVVVNNSILLVDAANQARHDGLRPGLAIGRAIERRFRPLIATTLTTVVGLLPLALSNPFWEALAFTLIGGLISSTIVVVLCFPVFYLAVEKFRTPLRNWARRRMGRAEV